MMNESGNLNQFEALFNYATIGIVVTEANGKIINFNKCAEQQFGYTKEEVLGKTIELLLPKEFHASHIRYRKEFFGDPHPRRMGEGRDLYGRKTNY